MDDEQNIKGKLYQQACASLGYSIERIGEDGGLLKVSNERTFFVVAFNDWPPLNTASARAIAKDKVLTKTLLTGAAIATPIGEHVFVSGKNDWEPTQHLPELAYTFAEKNGYPVFVKPHNASRGRGARLCNSEEDLTSALQDIAAISHVAVVEEVLRGREGRLMCIDGEVLFMYHKKVDANTGIANLAAGGELVNLTTTDIPHAHTQLAQKVFEAFGKDLRLYAVDFFETDDGIVVVEVNAHPFLSSIYAYGHQDVACSVLMRAIQAYFQ